MSMRSSLLDGGVPVIGLEMTSVTNTGGCHAAAGVRRPLCVGVALEAWTRAWDVRALGLSCLVNRWCVPITREGLASDSMGLSCNEKVMAWRMVVASRCNPVALVFFDAFPENRLRANAGVASAP